jgi:hypothetical protein
MGLEIWSEKLPASVQAIQAKLDPEMQEAFARDYTRRRKTLLIAYPLCVAGWHYLYLGKFGRQLAFFFTLGGCFVWFLVDLFRLPGMVAIKNNEIAGDLATAYRIGTEPMGRLPEFLS